MKSYLKLMIAVLAVIAAAFAGGNIILNNAEQGGEGRPYRVEAQRIAGKIARGEEYDLEDCETITNVEKLSGRFESGDSDYLVKEIYGTLYRFDYEYHPGSGSAALMFNLCFGAAVLIVIGAMLFVCFRIVLPFEKISGYPSELARGNLTPPLKEHRGKYFGKFIWGLDLLREKLESQREAELFLQKQNKTMVLSLSHDVKTPLGAIELYAKALERGLYSDEEKKRETARSICSKCEEIRGYVDKIAKSVSDDFLDLEVENREFYLSDLIGKTSDFYTDKLSLLKTGFHIDSFRDCLLGGDLERAYEVMQNVIENAIKYGDGKEISISFDREDDCQLIRVSNTGCALEEHELPHIFDSFWRGSNVGSNGGSGLGLYICRQLMRKMNGEIYAEAKDGLMTVIIVFPLA